MNFRIGDDFGRLLFDLAYERIVCEHDLQKAVSVITESLTGCTTDLALEVISGKRVFVVDTEAQDVIIEDYEESKHPKPFDWNEWCRSSYHMALTSFDGFSLAAAHTTNDLAKLYQDQGIDVNIDFDKVLKYILADNPNDIVEEIASDIEYAFKYGASSDLVARCKGTIAWGKQLIEKTVKLAQLMKQLGKCGIFSDNARANMYPHFLETRVQAVHRKLVSFAKGPMETDCDELERYLDSMRRIDKELKAGIKPIDHINDKEAHDAYWISPEGHAYALDGEIANMLHYQMAHAIINQEKVREIGKDEGNDAYRQLEEAGWAKITSENWLLFDATHCKLTKEQQYTIGIICQTINFQKRQMIRVGFQQRVFTGINIKSMDLVQLQSLLTI
jgi:hypothetical protein